LGNSVAIMGDTILAGAPACTIAGQTDAGAAYIFSRSGTPPGWTQTAKLSWSTTAAPYRRFGIAAALTQPTSPFAGPVALVGADQENNIGAAYAFQLTPINGGAAWVERTRMVALDTPGAGNQPGFGRSISAEGTTAVIGAPFDSASANGAGAAYVFSSSST